MFKHIILITSLFFSAYVQPILFGPNTELEDQLEKFAESYQAMTQNISNKQIYLAPYKINYYYNGRYSHSGTTHLPECANAATRKVFATYKDQFMELRSQFIYNAWGDGFILGVAGAILNKIVFGKVINFKTSTALIASAIYTATLQDTHSKPVPYYHLSNLKHENDLRLHKFSRALITTTATWVSYLAANCVINKKNML